MAATAGAALMTAGVAACGTVKELTAAQKVSSALDRLGEGKDLSVKLTLDATPEQLVAFARATGDAAEQKGAEGLAGASLSITVHADKPLKDVTGSASGLPAQGADQLAVDYLLADRTGAPAAEVRMTGKTLYLRTDVAVLAKLGGEDPAGARAEIDRAAAELGPLHDALTGGWVALDAAAVTALQDGAPSGSAPSGGAPSAQPSGRPSVGAQDVTELVDAVRGALVGDLAFEAKGTADGAEKVQVSAPFKKLAGDLLNAVKPFAKKLPGGEDFPAELPADVLDKNVVADLSIRGGVLSTATVDLAQLDQKVPADVHVPLRLTFDRSAPAVQAPDKSTKLTGQDLQKAVGSLLLGFGGGPGAADAGAGAAGGGDLPKAAPLTDAQVKELVQKTGQPAERLRAMNQLGMGYDDILALAQQGG
ncbi:hypothetical protein ACFW1A_26760 [Kitasatospora sp. NPDC058965]|uniref:hypothetical protein n=1 Tax=Kitasatospora sp. NPDC058965 TaxID=3346682 RepID=UPI0036C24EA0